MANETRGRKILIIEDDPALALGLKDTLEFEGFQVVHSSCGEAGLNAVTADGPHDCILLDLMLPDMNGYEVCQRIRAADGRVPVIMLTARGQEADKIRGLDAGADDYVTKPFSVGELVARIRAVSRRHSLTPTPGERFVLGEVAIDLASHQLIRDGLAVSLSPYEVELLRLLYGRLGEPVSRDEILDRVWGTKANPTNRTVDNFVVKLRRKIEPDQEGPRHILTVYGLGYKLVP